MERTENRRDISLPRVFPFTKDFSFHKEQKLNLQMILVRMPLPIHPPPIYLPFKSSLTD